jgi:hypothetical protein
MCYDVFFFRINRLKDLVKHSENEFMLFNNKKNTN